MTNVEYLKNYIKEEIKTRGFDKYNQIEIDFAGLGEEEEILSAIEELGYLAGEGYGLGVYWVAKKED